MAKWEGSTHLTVNNSSDKVALAKNQIYVLHANTDLYYKVDVTGGSASAADGSHFLRAGAEREISSHDTDKFLHWIRESADGVGTLSKVSL